MCDGRGECKANGENSAKENIVTSLPKNFMLHLYVRNFVKSLRKELYVTSLCKELCTKTLFHLISK